MTDKVKFAQVVNRKWLVFYEGSKTPDQEIELDAEGKWRVGTRSFQLGEDGGMTFYDGETRHKLVDADENNSSLVWVARTSGQDPRQIIWKPAEQGSGCCIM
jgi:hypothetical protein